MANRREEERERLRQAREEREKKQSGSERRRLMIGYGVAGVIGLAVLVGIIVVIVSAANKNDGGEAHIDQAIGLDQRRPAGRTDRDRAAAGEGDEPARRPRSRPTATCA